MIASYSIPPLRRIVALVLALSALSGAASAQSAAGLQQGLAQAVAGDPALVEFYGARGYQPIWMGGGAKDKQRVTAFLDALNRSGNQGLPTAAYKLPELSAAVKAARSPADRIKVEALLSQTFVRYANDVQSGILNPRQASADIDRNAPRRGAAANLTAFSKSSPKGFLKALPPQSASRSASKATRRHPIRGSMSSRSRRIRA